MAEPAAGITTNHLQLLHPGFYRLNERLYHDDPCPAPSLSGSLAALLLNRSPLHAWFNHPRLNPAFEPVETSRLDLGSGAHKLLLGEGADIEIIGADSFQTKAAREARDTARAAGKIPLLDKDYARAAAMAKIASPFLATTGLRIGAFTPEQVIVWREGQAWCRGMMDAISNDHTVILDYKTTAASARPDAAERSLYDLNYHFKAAFYERGLDVLCPETVGRRRFVFLFQEIDAPYACSIIEPSPGGLTIGRKQMTYAIRLWQRCMAENNWPGYGDRTHVATPSPWIERQWLEREMNDEFATGETAPGGRVEPTVDRQFQGWTP